MGRPIPIDHDPLDGAVPDDEAEAQDRARADRGWGIGKYRPRRIGVLPSAADR
ncbi:MAG: hypothetical protein AVDCRST_MAG73-1455 [uncultured Thermomicrobiales bacterium]|uniref:Uncharacterized protein n=1 Tax=uncultured Thermomicrobiales bacterium TaxID=1645740 RepID=A0A6J4U077_9BACT|nr:MAG: hypothetical protein AVDCRST_MAG73-1455 [uncultured Thermomicrobiales bacterium]